MTSTHVELLHANYVDDSREEILQIIRDNGDKSVIYVHGWCGLGASAVLKSIAEVLPSRRTTPELFFGRIIYINCSERKSRRAVQRAIAKELELDNSVMAILDKQDEEDDFHGVDESSRNAIKSVSRMINHILEYVKFIVIFHSGSDDEINLDPLGVPPFGEFTRNIMIWTYRRRKILTIKKVEQHEPIQKLGYNHLVVYSRISYLTTEKFYALLSKEAATVVDGYECMRGVNPAMVVDCYLYKLFLQCSFNNTIKSGFTGLASNYWRCDGILQEDITQEASNMLHREISWECADDVLAEYVGYFNLPFLVVKDDDVYEQRPYRWISITSRDSKVRGMQTIPPKTTSFLLAFQISDQPPALPIGLFEHSSNLGVLVLCCCAFDFASPPFLKCQSLRFLGVDHCTDGKTIVEREDHTEWTYLHSLLVLDLCYTEWNEIFSLEKMDLMTKLMDLSIEGVWCWKHTSGLHWRLPNLRRLRVIKPTYGPEVSTDPSNPFLDDETKLESNFFLDKTKLEILDLSGNSEMKILPNSLSKASSLQVLVLDGCDGLENVVLPDGLPHSLKSFSFDGYGPAFYWAPTVELPLKHERPSTVEENKRASISKISLACSKGLENLFVRGLPNLIELNLSGSTIKTLDFETMVVEVPLLKRLFLLGCEHLRCINWSNNTDFKLDLLCIDTRAGTTDCSRPSLDRNKSFKLQVHAVLADGRLAWSLRYLLSEGIEDVYFNILVTSSPMYSGSVQLEEETYKKTKTGLYSDQVGLLQFFPAGRYSDVYTMVGDAPMQVFPKPPANNLDRHVEIAKESHGLESSLMDSDSTSLGYIMKEYAESLHVHDVSVSGSMPAKSWNMLKQCHVERCPKLDEVFPSNSCDFDKLKIFWASDLLMARWIVGTGGRYGNVSFGKLQHLHLRSCPRLQYVLPVWRWRSSFPCLETLHIIHCGDLKHAFVLDRQYPKKITTQGVSFPKLTTIHLHDLPALRQICDEVKMVAPALETIKIRGCWGLRRLPVVGSPSGSAKKPTVEIEEDVWDALEWDGDHHPGHFQAPLCSRYRKKKLPRVSLLR